MERTTRSEHEGGNAVALTLLGLAVMIVAGVAVLYVTGRHTPQPIPTPREVASSTDDVVDLRAGWKTYEDSQYAFTVQYPSEWVVATGTIGTGPVITFAPGVLGASSSAVYHEAATRVSVYPRGTALWPPADESVQSPVIVAVPQASARDFILESKRPWATVVQFGRVPGTWDPSGIVVGRTAIEDEAMRPSGGEGVDTASSSPERVVRTGFVDPALRGTVEEVLRSFVFAAAAPEGGEVGGGETANIVVEAPERGAVLTSPVTVRGKARGSWYFEASFPVTLRAADGTVLATVPARAIGDWMTDDFVPFEVSVAFDPGTATSGELVLARDNPSGIRAQDASATVPVQFAAVAQ